MRRLNVKLFVGLIVGSILIVGALALVHWLQTGRIAQGMLARSEQAEDQGEIAEAARFLGRYLELAPEDTDARARLGKLLADERLATNSKARTRALFVLEQVLVKQPDANDLRLRLVRLALDLRRHDLARDHLNALAKAWPDHGDVAFHQGLLAEAESEWEAAAKFYRRTIELTADKLEAYVRLADILRRRLGNEAQERNAREADEVMDRLVENNVERVPALLGRWRYRRQWQSLAGDAGKLQEAAADVRRALELAPSEAETLLAAGDLALLEKKYPEARALLGKGRQGYPHDARFVRELASLELRENRRDQAIACLQEGIEQQRGEGRAELLWTQANILLDIRQVEQAQKAMAELAKTSMSPAALDYLQARIHIIEARWNEAARLLERRRDLLASSAELARQTDLLLSQCHEHMNEPEMQRADYSRMVSRDPLSVQGRLGLASSLLALGRTEDALEQYRRLIQLPGAPAFAWVELARLVLVRNLQRPKADWTEVEDAIEKAANRNADALDVQLLKAEMQTARQNYDQARQILLEAQKNHADRFETWVTLAELADRQNQPEEKQRCLMEAEKLGAGNIEAQAALIRFWSRRSGAEGDAALTRAAAGLDQRESGPRARILTELAQAYFRRGNLKEAARCWEQLTEFPDNQHDVRLRLILFEVALQTGNDQAMQRYRGDLQRIEGAQGTFFRYATALHKIWQARQGERQGLEEARNLLDAVAADRPSWSAVLLAKADIEAMRGNGEQAIVQYRKAIELGERNPRVVRQLVQLLYQQQRFDEAEQEIRRLQRLAPSADLQRLIVDIALRKQDPLQAAREALDAVATDSNDYRDHLWLGQVLALANQQPELADKHLRRAVELGAENPETWLALVQFLTATGQRKEAEETIAQAQAKISAERAALALAQCYEAIGNLKKAEEQYRAYLAGAPDEALRLRSLANFYIRVGRLPLAEPLLRKLMNQAGSDAAWARRALAVGLASTADQRQAAEALQLINPKSEDPADRRAQARVLAALPLKSQRSKAIQMLEEMAQKQTLPADDQLLLATLYQADGVWPKARDLLRQLTTQSNHPQPLLAFARGLLQNRELNEAERCINRLEQMEKDRRLPAGTCIELRLLLLEAKGQNDKSLMLAKQFGEADPQRPERVLVWLATLIRQKRYNDVLAVWDRVKNDAPPELISGAVVASLRAGQKSPEACNPVKEWLEACLQKSPKSPGLMLHLADLHDHCGRYGEAEPLYRQVLALNADHVVALNNLAWLLAQQAGKGEEALTLANRAIERAGPRPELLDTRASAYLALKKPDLATADLESANAEQPAASRYFLLAQAQRQANNTQRAADFLKKATAAGLKAEQLHPAERGAFLKLTQELGPR